MTASPSTVSAFVLEATFSSSRTDAPALPVPKTGEAADDMLTFTRDRLRGPEGGRIARELARFLGANSAVWTWSRREALRELLVSVGARGALAALEALERSPRTDVSDEAEVVVREVLRQSPLATATLVTAFDRSRSVAVRSTVIRALGSVRDQLASSVVHQALDAHDPEVRESAIFALGEQEGRTAESVLRRRRETESNPVVVDAIEEVLSELESG